MPGRMHSGGRHGGAETSGLQVLTSGTTSRIWLGLASISWNLSKLLLNAGSFSATRAGLYGPPRNSSSSGLPIPSISVRYGPLSTLAKLGDIEERLGNIEFSLGLEPSDPTSEEVTT